MGTSYFVETDTLHLEFSDRPVEDTRDLSENVVIDLDAERNLVALTLDRAQMLTTVFDLTFQQVMPLREAVPA